MPTTDLTTLFSDIADAIRGKDGTSATIQASTFPARITAIPSGGGGTVNVSLSGDLSYTDYNGVWDGVFTNNSINISLSDVTNLECAFESSNLQQITQLSGNIFRNNSISSLRSVFNGCKNLQSIGISGLQSVTGSNNAKGVNAFNQCNNLRTITMTNYVGSGAASMFSNCYSLRQLPFRIQSGDTLNATYTLYKNGFSACYVLDEIDKLGVSASTFTSNVFTAFPNCCRLMKLTFDTNNGTVLTANWKTQTIDLSNRVGYAQNDAQITGYNSGITTAKKVTDATSYVALKNDPDWYTLDIAYSRYNHDSAVETINTLPDTSAYIATAGGTNTIKFSGSAGSATDGGAINTLTASEIAVATAKGWTVTLV